MRSSRTRRWSVVYVATLFLLPWAGLGSPASAVPPHDLRFLTQPADAEKGAAISSVDVDPAGDPVQVEVLNNRGERLTSPDLLVTLSIDPGSPNPAPGATLSGETTVQTDAGVATFRNISIDMHGTYQLVATGSTSGPSSPFTIWDEVEPCAGGRRCSVSVGVEFMTATLAGTPGTGEAGVLLMSVGADTLRCGDRENDLPQVVTVDATFTADGQKVGTVVLTREWDQLRTDNGAGRYRICYLSEDLNEGVPTLLDDCDTRNPVPPCVLSVKKSQRGQVIIRILLPEGDPRWT